MAKQLQLTIPTPCHEDWDAMTPVDKGKFCGSCQKQVVDFTNMSDRQVAEFFKKPSTGSVCGRFMNDQLDRTLGIPKKRIPWVKYFFQFALPAFLLSLKTSSVKAQGKVMVKESKTAPKKQLESNTQIISDTIWMDEVVVTTLGNATKGKVVPTCTGLEGKVSGPVIASIEKKIAIQTVRDLSTPSFIDSSQYLNGRVGEVSVGFTEDIILQGRVVDETGTPVPGASVKIKGIRGGVLANNLGIFNIKANEGDILLVLGVGIIPTEMVVSKKNGIEIVVKRAITGDVTEVVIVGAVRKVPKKNKNIFLQKPVPIDTNQSNFRIFPNPVVSGSGVTIEYRKIKSGNYFSQIVNQAGQSVHQEEIWIDEKAKSFRFDVPQVPGGTYFLILINKKSGKKYSEKIIIQ